LKARERRRPVNATKPASSKPGPKVDGTTLCEKKKLWRLKKSKIVRLSPPKKGNPGVKPKSKGTPLAPQWEMKKNIPKKLPAWN